MRFTVCELQSPPIKSLIEQNYVPWYSHVDNSAEWFPYASGLGGFTLPLICVIDPADPDNYLDRTTGVQDPDDFHARLQSHVVTTYTLHVIKSGPGTVTVTSTNNSLQCGADCTYTSKTFSSGTSVTLTATLSGNSTFTGWSGGGCSGTGPCSVTINGDKTVTARFASNDPVFLPMIKPLLLRE